VAPLNFDWVFGSIGTVEPSLTDGEFAHAFLVSASEVKAKFKECLIGDRVDAPHVTGCGEDPSGFEEEEGQVLQGIVGKRNHDIGSVPSGEFSV